MMATPAGSLRASFVRFLSRASNLLSYPALIRTIGSGLNRSFVRDLLLLRDDIGFVPASIVDAGASVGAWSRAALFVYPGARVRSFEPVPSSFSELSALEASHANIACYPFALGAKNGTRTLYRNSFTDASSLLRMTAELPRLYPHAALVSPHEVEERRLDSIPELVIESPALLKLDVQGAELEALEGCGRLIERFDAVIVELNFSSLYLGQADPDRLVTALRSMGFTRFVQLQPEAMIRSGLHSCDVLFLRNRIRDGITEGR